MNLKKLGIGGAVILSIALSPFIGKGVENTTKALLPGLSTEEQIVTVADVVDQNKVEAEARVAEMQVVIDEQSAKLVEQQKVIDEQKTDIVETNASVVKGNDCSADIGMYCGLKQYRDFKEYADFKESTLQNCYRDESKLECEKIFNERYAPAFDKCQLALRCD